MELGSLLKQYKEYLLPKASVLQKFLNKSHHLTTLLPN